VSRWNGVALLQRITRHGNEDLMKAFVGADIGTTGIRASVYDERFQAIGSGGGESILHRGPDGSITQDPEEIFRETAKAVCEAVAASGVHARDVAGLSFDGQMAGILGIDEGWKAVTPYDSWLDTRCAAQVAAVRERAREAVIRKTGIIPSYNHGPKILWWRDRHPELFERVASFIQPAAYVAGRLCGLRAGDAFLDWTYLHFSGFSDTAALCWDDELLSLFEVPRSKLPKIVSPRTVVGEVRPEQAEAFGVRAGTPVAAGCGDATSCLFGAGAVDVGIAVDIAGTAAVLALAIDSFAPDPTGLVYASLSVEPDIRYSMSYINGGGMNLEWFKETFAPHRSFDDLNREIEAIGPGSDGLTFVPHLEGRGYPNVPHMRGHWKGFTRQHTLGHFYRSVLEGTGYEYALYKQSILSRHQGDLQFVVRGVGGGAKSPVWNQIKADILGCDYCTIDREDIALLGQALIAAGATGHVHDLRTKVRELVRVERVFHPDPARTAMYAQRIAEYGRMLDQYGESPGP
jgi:xylulokinase